MKGDRKDISALGYFRFFYSIVGYRIFIYVLLNFLVGLLDGLGLAMFIPLLSVVTGSSTEQTNSMGELSFLVDILKNSGFPINLVTILLFMVLLFLLKGLVNYLKTLYFIKMRLYTGKYKRFQLIEGLYHLSYQGFTKLDSGKIQNNMVSETGKMLNAMVQFFNSIQNIILLSTYVFLAFLSNWKFALMVAAGAALTNFLYRYIYKVTKKKSRELTFVGNDFNGNLIQAIHNFKYLKATNYFAKYIEKLRINIINSERISYKIGKLGATAESLREPLIIIVIASVILIQVQLLNNDFGSILVSLLLFYRSLSYLVTVQNNWNGFIGASAGIDSVENLLLEFDQNKEVEGSETIQHIRNIRLNSVGMKFGSKQILEDIELFIPQKNSIALVGESGAGKTTLANIICGLQPPTAGTIMIDDKSLYHTNLNNYRDKIGYITQEPVIFNDSVFNNVTFWADKSDSNLVKFWNTLAMVSIKNFVENLDEVEDTKLGNNGILISGGQKQRISIARELFKDVELLIMDEATSALDSETEKFIKNNIDTLHGKFTILIIAHRLSTIKNVDTIYLLEDGKILEQGNFDDLCGTSEKFRRMVELQEV